MTFNEHNINRETDGKFGAKVGGAPDISLSIPVSGTVQKQHWVGDYAIDAGDREDLDMTTILDTQTLSSIREMEDTGERDWIYEEAQAAGLAQEHTGPFYVGIDEDQLEQYIARRESLGQEEPLLADVPLSQAKAREVTGKALAAAHTTIPVTAVLAASALSQQAAVLESFKEAATKFDALDFDALDYRDQVAVQSVRDIASGTDPRGGTFHQQALMSAASLADHLLNRDAHFAAVDKAAKDS